MAISRRAYLLMVLTLMAGLLVAFAGVASATALDTLTQRPFPPTDVCFTLQEEARVGTKCVGS